MKTLTKFLLILFTPFLFADVSNFTLESTSQDSQYVGLSDNAMCETIDGQTGECYVDNNLRTLYYPGGWCYYGGDPEGVAQYQIGKVYILNEGAAGLAIVDLALSSSTGGLCHWERRIKTGLPKGGEGLEGIEIAFGLVYLLQENGDLYYFIDDGIVEDVSPTFVFNVDNCNNECGGLGMHDNGNFLAIVGQSDGKVLEFSPYGQGETLDELSVNLDNGEGVMMYDGKIIITGEPDHRSVYVNTSDPGDPVDPICTFEAGSIVFDLSANQLDPITVTLTCDDGITRTGTLQ